MNLTTRTNQNSRRGVTLLLTISMIVLFLLMGTAFVIVANDYFKTSRRRSNVSSFRVDSTALLDRAFYDVFRGIDLRDTNSPLRAQSILEDQYGYGLTTPLSSVADGPTAALKVLVIDSPTLTYVRGDGTTSFPAADYRNGIFNGRVITVISADGQNYYSTRIISHFLDASGSTTQLLVTVPADPGGLLVAGTAVGERLLINGRDFSGFGAGDVIGLSGDNVMPPAGMVSDVVPSGLEPDFDYIATNPASLLGPNSLRPNRIGEALAALTADGGYLENDNGPNESYDIPDPQNMFLSGFLGNSVYRPSFHDGRISQNTLRTSFRPIVGTTATVAFNAALDVDTDGDGQLDAVWIDIGLPVQTDDQGRKFRPLVAYRIIDMDGRLNLNVHGSYADYQLLINGGGSRARRGSSYGAAEVSLGDVLGNAGGFTGYLDLLNTRSGVTEAPPRPGNQFNELGVAQNLFGHPDSTSNTGGLFSSGSDIFGRGLIQRGTAFGEESLPEFVNGINLSDAATISAYAADFSITGGGVGDDLFQAQELESLLRRFDVDTLLIGSSRLRDLGLDTNVDSLTTASFEVAVPPVSVMELLRSAVAADGGSYDDIITARYLSNDVLMGGRFDLNQIIGNGVDDDGDLTFDEATEANATSSRQDGLAFNVVGARQLKATQLYTLAMLVTGTTPPSYITGAGTLSPQQYRRAVAQWAINVVDFSDADSICTIFEYDVNPFNNMLVDGDPTTDEGGERGVVFGLERPEIIFNEVLATHDRRNQDLATDAGESETTDDNDGDMMPDDDDWDSGYLPVTSTYIELLNPNAQSDTVNSGNAATGFQRNAAELDPGQRGVLLSQTAANAVDGAPVWRIGVRRTDDVSEPFIRGIFFTDPTRGPADARFANDNFWPSSGTALVRPGQYFVLGSLGNAPSEQMSTFGRPIGGMEDIANTRGIILDETVPAVVVRDWDAAAGAMVDTQFDCDGVAVIDEPRSLSLSDPDGGYRAIVEANPAFMLDDTELDGTMIMPARDRPLDADANAEDINAIWNNGVAEGFRFIYLQRLADPTQPFNAMFNPYITVDKAKVDLLAFNGLENDPNNDGMDEHYDTDPADGVQGRVAVNDGDTEFRTIERGETASNVAQARRSRLRFERGEPVNANAGGLAGADNMNFSYEIRHTLGVRNEAHNGTQALGWLVWNNRPFANAMELIHVPFTSNETLLERVNFSRTSEQVLALDAMSEPEDVFAYYMSDDKFGHLIGYGGMSPVAGGGGEAATGSAPTARAPTFANRFDYIFDFVDVPSRFLGSKTFLPTNVVADPTNNGLMFNLQAPFNTVPNFREPGNVNVNTIPNATVYAALRGGFGSLSYMDFLADRNIDGSTSAFEGLFTSATGSQFVSPGVAAQANGGAGLFRRDATDLTTRIFDFESTGAATRTDTDSSSWFENEFRQRLGSVTTTRSSVFSIWITIGYFEVDAAGLVGAELGSEGQVRRDRAFYMVDRSIPVACEPGKNHNVDNAVLVRTTIE